MAGTRKNDDATSTPEPHSGVQGEGRLAALKGDKTLAELAQQLDVHANQITQWKSQLLEGAAAVFGEAKKQETAKVDVPRLHAKIGELSQENDFLESALTKAGILSAKR